MKIVFVSNYFNHHQKPFCDEMYKRLGDNFAFISTTLMREERRKLGYGQDDIPEYVFLAYESAANRAEALDLIDKADIVIAGGAPNDMIVNRIKNGRLVLRYSERPFKKRQSFIRKVYHSINLRRKNAWKNNVYMLCASAYAAEDYTSIGMYKNRMYKWGYFPDVKSYDLEDLLSKKKSNIILWCGRFIDWKHPDDAILLAKMLKDEGYDFVLNMIGTGEMEDKLYKMVDNLDLSNHVRFLGSMSPLQVRTYMEEAGIYLLTSDRQEGWGAVLNESMNSGCAVVASHAVGSAPYLIDNNKNGLIYTSGEVLDLFEKVRGLLDNSSEQILLGKAAYRTISSIWNAKVSADRLFKMVEECCLNGSCNLFEDGPCSKA